MPILFQPACEKSDFEQFCLWQIKRILKWIFSMQYFLSPRLIIRAKGSVLTFILITFGQINKVLLRILLPRKYS